MKAFFVRSILGLMLAFASGTIHAGEVLYKVDDIPANLKASARSVVRMQEIIFKVADENSATMSVTYAITVMNKNGIEDANFTEYYDKFKSVSAIRGRIFDAQGELVRKLGSVDIEDYSAISGFTMYDDNRVKFIDPKVRTYPFTVEYSYEVGLNGLYSYPSWFPQEGYNIAVEKSTFRVIMAEPFELRYVERNLQGPVMISSEEDSRIYFWQVSNLPAVIYEPLSPPMEEFFPSVLLAPSSFEIGGYPGKMDTWADLGDWFNSLNAGRQELTPEFKAILIDMTKSSASQYDKINLIYQYLQSTTRYVNVMIGMGGWQPIAASEVNRLSYGDCKGLTNYMMAMLDAVGIESFYCPVLAGAGADFILTDFPSPQFNHAMLCIPGQGDTIWLECTNQHLPCGFIGDFTDDRYVLLVNEGNSQLVRTKAYSIEENLTGRHSEIYLEADGTGRMIIQARYKGLDYETMLPVYLADDVEKKKMASSDIRFPNFQLTGYKYSLDASFIPSIDENLEIRFDNCLTELDSRYLLTLNNVNHMDNSPANVRNRKREVLIRRPFQEVDTIIYHLPDALLVENPPAPVSLDSQFGSYSVNVTVSGNTMIYARHLKVSNGKYPASSYADLTAFFNKVKEYDDMKCILLKK